MFDKKQKCCVKRIHLVTDDCLYDRKAFYEVKIAFIQITLWKKYASRNFDTSNRDYYNISKIQQCISFSGWSFIVF